MTDDKTTKRSNVVKMASGGRLYRDARTKDEAERVKRALQATEELSARIDDVSDLDLPEDLPPGADRPEPERPPMQMPDWGTIGPMIAPPPEPSPPPRDWREIRSTVLELAGVAVFAGGFWMLAPWAGIVVLGVCLILLGIAEGVK